MELLGPLGPVELLGVMLGPLGPLLGPLGPVERLGAMLGPVECWSRWGRSHAV